MREFIKKLLIKFLFTETISNDINYITVDITKWYSPTYNIATKDWYFLCFSKRSKPSNLKELLTMPPYKGKKAVAAPSLEEDLMNV